VNKGIIAVAMSSILVGCAAQTPEYRLGQFTAASSFNVRNLDYDSTSATRVKGEDCHQVGQPPNDSRLQRAMDQAIQNGQDQGITGDLLVAVGMPLTRHPPHRSVRAVLPHTAPASGDDGETARWARGGGYAVAGARHRESV